MDEKSFKRSIKLNLLQEAALTEGIQVNEDEMKT